MVSSCQERMLKFFSDIALQFMPMGLGYTILVTMEQELLSILVW